MHGTACVNAFYCVRNQCSQCTSLSDTHQCRHTYPYEQNAACVHFSLVKRQVIYQVKVMLLRSLVDDLGHITAVSSDYC